MRDIEHDIRVFDALMREDLYSFVRKVFKTLNPDDDFIGNWHIKLMCEYLQACTDGEIKRLIINVPPRSLKSVLVNVGWTAWLMGKRPSTKIMSASYSGNLSLKHSTDTRHVIRSEWYKSAFPEVVISPDQDTKSKFETTKGGFRFATSVGATATGEGGDFLIVDDPISATEGESKVKRIGANDWFDSTFITRLNNKKSGCVVVIMQRLHENDLTGHLLAKETGWEHLCLPAIATKKEIIDFGSVKKVREKGDLLHESREDREVLDQLQVDLGSYGFASQYQQEPAPSGGGVIKETWFKDSQPREYSRIIQSWDTAYKANQHNDPSCCTTWGEHETGWDLLHVDVSKMEYPTLKKRVIANANAWEVDLVLIEDKASGQSLIQELRAVSNVPIVAINPEGDKLTRAHTVSPLIEAGKVGVPKKADWRANYISELITFPKGEHDDQVDSTTQFLKWASSTVAQPRIRAL